MTNDGYAFHTHTFLLQVYALAEPRSIFTGFLEVQNLHSDVSINLGCTWLHPLYKSWLFPLKHDEKFDDFAPLPRKNTRSSGQVSTCHWQSGARVDPGHRVPSRAATSHRNDYLGPARATRSEGGKNSASSHQTTYRRKAFECGRVNATIKVMQLSQRQHTNTTYIKI